MVDKIKILLLVVVLLFVDTNAQGQKKAIPEIEGWYFRAVGGYPVSVTFELIVLFKNGKYVIVTEKPVERISFDLSKRESPHLWGTWKKSNHLFVLTDEKSEVYKYDLADGDWFPAFPFIKSFSLKGTYEKTSGGDYGDGAVALFQSTITFLDDSHFTHSEDMGIVSYDSGAWKNNKNAGTYKIEGHIIELKYNDGKSKVLSFAVGAEGDEPSTEMLFIGGQPYVIE